MRKAGAGTWAAPVDALLAPWTRVDRRAQRFGISDIARVMEHKWGWSVAANVMRTWFSLPAREMSLDEKLGAVRASGVPEPYRNSSLITMAWLSRFERAMAAADALEKKLDRPAVHEAIRRRVLAQQGASRSSQGAISNSGLAMTLHDHWQIDYEPVGYDTGTGLDDLYGALGAFALYAAVLNATVAALPDGKLLIKIHRVGIYMRDTFDFIGHQYPGALERCRSRHQSGRGAMGQPSSLGAAGMEPESRLGSASDQ